MISLKQAELFKEEKYIDKKSGCLMHFVDSDTEPFILHYHDYYEIFLTTDNDLVHIINGSEQVLPPCTLVFIRPGDVHTFRLYNKRFHFINLTFDSETIESLFSYLSDGFPAEELLNAKFPPSVGITKSETETLISKIMSLNTYDWNDKNHLKTQMRIVVADIFAQFFGTFKIINDEKPIPVWLEKMCGEMMKTDNFSAGIKAMISISGKTYEHISRSMKKFMNTTPTAYINDLRMNYAANMLINSNSSISEICYDSGFQNISWFYEYFKKKYGISPKKFRTLHKIQ